MSFINLRWSEKLGQVTKLNKTRKPVHYEKDQKKIHSGFQDPR